MLEMISIRIVVKIPESIYPELISDLSRVQLRDRAERLRVLAMLGLKDLKGSLRRCNNDSNSVAYQQRAHEKVDKKTDRKSVKAQGRATN